QPPDWWNASGPRAARRRSITSTASGVAVTSGVIGLEEAHWVGVVAHQQALGLRVVVEHHAVVLASHARGLVAAEGGMRRVVVVAVRPHTAGLDRTTHPERATAVKGPDAGAEPVQGVVRDRERLA